MRPVAKRQSPPLGEVLGGGNVNEVSPFAKARESPAVSGRAQSRAGNGTIIEPIMLIIGPCIYLVYSIIARRAWRREVLLEIECGRWLSLGKPHCDRAVSQPPYEQIWQLRLLL